MIGRGTTKSILGTTFANYGTYPIATAAIATGSISTYCCYCRTTTLTVCVGGVVGSVEFRGLDGCSVGCWQRSSWACGTLEKEFANNVDMNMIDDDDDDDDEHRVKVVV